LDQKWNQQKAGWLAGWLAFPPILDFYFIFHFSDIDDFSFYNYDLV
jgi:hypothetical protein